MVYFDYYCVMFDEYGIWCVFDVWFVWCYCMSIGIIVSDVMMIVCWWCVFGGGVLGLIEEGFIVWLCFGDNFLFVGCLLELVCVQDMMVYVWCVIGKCVVVLCWNGGCMLFFIELVYVVVVQFDVVVYVCFDSFEMEVVCLLLELQVCWFVLFIMVMLVVEILYFCEGWYFFFYLFVGWYVYLGLVSLLGWCVVNCMLVMFFLVFNDYGFEFLLVMFIDWFVLLVSGEFFVIYMFMQDVLVSFNVGEFV